MRRLKFISESLCEVYHENGFHIGDYRKESDGFWAFYPTNKDDISVTSWSGLILWHLSRDLMKLNASYQWIIDHDERIGNA